MSDVSTGDFEVVHVTTMFLIQSLTPSSRERLGGRRGSAIDRRLGQCKQTSAASEGMAAVEAAPANWQGFTWCRPSEFEQPPLGDFCPAEKPTWAR